MRAGIYSLFSLTLLLTGCGPNEVDVDPGARATTDKIVGGYESTPGSRPWQVSLQSYGSHFCGGALLNSEWVLTAAHCVAGSSASSLQVRVGLHRLSSNEGQTIQVAQVISHSGYNSSTMVNDIALLKLAAPASSTLTPVQLPTSAVMSEAAAPGDMVLVSGWGTTSEGGSLADALQEVWLPVASNATCNSPQSYNGEIYDSMICAGYASGGKDSCQGDSGGPMVVEYGATVYSVGIVSWGYGCAQPDMYGVYTRTHSHVAWIESYVDGGGGGGGGELTELDNGVPVSGLAGSQGAWLEYFIDVPADATNLVIQTSGGSGDADLYVRFGSEPTTSAYDCRPYLNGNSESCTVAAPSAGTYYAFVRGYTAFSSLTLQASFTTGGGGGGGGEMTILDNGVPVTGIGGSKGEWVEFAVDVPAGASSLVINTTGGSGDADLYVRFGAEPTTSAYDCRPYKAGNIESCSVATPAEGRYYAFLYGYSAFASVTLEASYEVGGGGGGIETLDNGETVSSLAGSQGDWIYYRIDVPAGTSVLQVQISGGTGDADLYTLAGEQPTTSNYDCRPYMYGNNETCTISNPLPGYHYIGVRAYTSYSGVSLTAGY